MSKRQFTAEELLGRWEDNREIQNIMGKLSMHYALRREDKVFEEYWSSRDDICLGVNEGWYSGKAAVKGFYDALRERTLLTSKLIKEYFPKTLGDKTEEEVYGVGLMSYKPLDTAIVEIAGDGQTAKGIWYCRGSYDELTSAGPVAYWEWSYYAVDFVWEDGEWKIWHLLNVYDVNTPGGDNWGKGSEEWTKFDEIEAFAAMKDFKMPEPNVKTTLREYYHVMRPFTPTPEPPEPYETFAETFSYGM